uniref:Uncharacterized protein n=1 Tax=Arundo donax TaxID=35708 RepID=A0A0A9FAL8_ARUDO
MLAAVELDLLPLFTHFSSQQTRSITTCTTKNGN